MMKMKNMRKTKKLENVENMALKNIENMESTENIRESSKSDPANSCTKVVPRNKAGPLRTWPLLIVILRISSTHFLQRVRVFFKHLKETQHLLGAIMQECFIFKPGKSATG